MPERTSTDQTVAKRALAALREKREAQMHQIIPNDPESLAGPQPAPPPATYYFMVSALVGNDAGRALEEELNDFESKISKLSQQFPKVDFEWSGAGGGTYDGIFTSTSKPDLERLEERILSMISRLDRRYGDDAGGTTGVDDEPLEE